MLCPLYRQERTQLRQDPALSAPSCLWYSYGFTPQALHNNLIKTQAELVHQTLLISQLSFLQSVAATQPLHVPNLLQPKKAVSPLPPLAFPGFAS